MGHAVWPSPAGSVLVRRLAAVTVSRATTVARRLAVKGVARCSSDGGSTVSGVWGARWAASRQWGLTVVVVARRWGGGGFGSERRLMMVTMAKRRGAHRCGR
jgi:hypothetical protein